MLSFRGMSGRIYQLNRSLAEGGEGTVYSILNDESRVAKIYKKEHFKTGIERETATRKLKTMLSMKLSGYVDNVLRFTWPQDILYQDEMMVGFVMPRINEKLNFYSICREGDDIKKIYPNFTWKYSVQFAYNLARTVQYLHERGVIVGDFNQTNICVDPKTSAVILIDCDSFVISDSKTRELFPCTVGFSEVLAPELQVVKTISKARFTETSDNFSLAIHIFRLLMKNADPFGGIKTDEESTVETIQNQAIINGECPYVRDVNKTIPKWSPRLEAMPSEVRSLFDRTFNYTVLTANRRRHNRPTAEEWCRALYPYAKAGRPGVNRHLKQCRHNKMHVYPAHNRKCPWCACEGVEYDPAEELFDKLILVLPKIMLWLVVLSAFGEAVYLYGMANNLQSVWTVFRSNLLSIRFDGLTNAFIFEKAIILDKYAQLCVNVSTMRLKSAAFIKTNPFWNNNQTLFGYWEEYLLNLAAVTLALVKRRKNVLQLAQSNIVIWWKRLCCRVKEFAMEGRRWGL